MPRYLALILPLVACLAGQTIAIAGATQTRWEREYAPALSIEADQELLIRGRNPGREVRTLIVRMDDSRSNDYASRVNLELTLPPGAFTSRIGPAQLRTTDGRPLALDDVRRIIIFPASKALPLALGDVSFDRARGLPAGVLAWDLGPASGAAFPGFQVIGPEHPSLKGQRLKPLSRPSGDALIQDGIQGVERVHLPLEPGRWRITLWTEDPGEWEFMPHPIERRVQFNGETVFYERLEPLEWIERVYRRFAGREAVIDGSPWDLFGSLRGGVIEAEVQVAAAGLNIDLAGSDRWATYLAGLTASPLDVDAHGLVQQAREQRFDEIWKTPLVRPLSTSGGARIMRRAVGGRFPIDKTALQASPDTGPSLAARGTLVRQEYALIWARDVPEPEVSLELPRLEDQELAVDLHWGRWDWRREQAASTLLVPRSNRLVAEPGRLVTGIPRRLLVSVHVPRNAPAGNYRGRVLIDGEAIPLAIEVLPTRLPGPGLPIGVYLEDNPPLTWFPKLAHERVSQRGCDLDTLARMGLTGLAAPLPTPWPKLESDFLEASEQLQSAGFGGGAFAYSTVKRLGWKLPPEEIGAQLARLEGMMKERRVQPPIWSIADEPSNPSHGNGDVVKLSKAIRAAGRKIKLAAHLNTSADRRFLRYLDYALLNPGFGVDVKNVRRIRASGTRVWFYNMGLPRLASGFYLWKSGAGGYLQWHARMPTADPFDPTDGREDDFQMLYPMAEICAPLPELDSLLVDMAEGILDLRWLRWLERRAKNDDRADDLLDEISDAIPDRWDAMKALGSPAAADWRRRIQQLARQGGD